MPMFQTFADYDKWRRRQLMERLQKLQNLPMRPDSIIVEAAKAGDPSIRYGRLSRGLQDGIDRDSFQDDGISDALRAAIDTLLNPGDPLSDAFSNILEGTANQTDGGKPKSKPPNPNKGGGKGKDKGKDGGGQGPNSRGGGEGAYGGDLVLATHDGAFYTHRTSQLDGLDNPIPPGTAVDNYTLSVWIRMNGQKTSTTRITWGQISTRLQALFWNANGSMTFLGYNERGTLYANDTTSTNLLTDGQLHHLMVGVQSAPADKVQIWVDGSLVSDQLYAGSFLPLGEESDWYICANHTGANLMDSGDQIGGMWQGNEYVSDPVGVFIEAAQANPVALTGGTDGSEFTGTQPLIYFNDVADWNAGTNQGSGGAFTVVAGTMGDTADP